MAKTLIVKTSTRCDLNEVESNVGNITHDEGKCKTMDPAKMTAVLWDSVDKLGVLQFFRGEKANQHNYNICVYRLYTYMYVYIYNISKYGNPSPFQRSTKFGH